MHFAARLAALICCTRVAAADLSGGVATIFVSGTWPRPCANSWYQNYSEGETFPLQWIQLHSSLNGVEGDYMLALGIAVQCPFSPSAYDRRCNTTVWPEVAASPDGGLTWTCVSDGTNADLAVSRLWPAVFTWSSSSAQTPMRRPYPSEDEEEEEDDEDGRAETPSCDMVCVAGGQDARPDLPYSQYAAVLSSVYCSRNGSVWYPAAPLPSGATAGTASALNDKILYLGALRADGSGDTFVGTVDPIACTISSWARRGGNSALVNRTQIWSMASPALPAWKGPGNSFIGGKAVLFVGGGAVPTMTFQDVSAWAGESLYSAVTPRDMWWTVDEGNTWGRAGGLLPGGSSPHFPVLQKAAMLRGYLPPANPFLAVNTSESRVLLLFLSNHNMYVSVDDGKTWGNGAGAETPFLARLHLPSTDGSGADSYPSPFLIAPTLISTGIVSSSNPSPVINLVDPFSGTFMMGYAFTCLNQCPVGDDWKLANPCNRTPFDAVCYRCSSCIEGQTWQASACSVQNDTECRPCTVCPETYVAVLPCTVERDTVCDQFVGLPSIPPDVPAPGFGLPGERYETNPVADSLLVACTVAMWLLFVAAGGAFSLCAAGARSLIPARLRTYLSEKGRSTWLGPTGREGGVDAATSSGAPAGPSLHPAVWRMTAGHVAFICYLALDVSILGRAARINGMYPGDRPVNVAQGILGLVCLLLNGMASFWQLKRQNEAALRLAASLKAPSHATPALALSPLWASFSHLLLLHEQVRVALVFCAHPLASVWLSQHISLLLEEGRAFTRKVKDEQSRSSDVSGRAGVRGASAGAAGALPVEAWTPRGGLQQLSARMERERLVWASAASVAAVDGVHLLLGALLLTKPAETLSAVLAGTALACAVVSIVLCTLVVAARPHLETLQPQPLKGKRTRMQAVVCALMGIPSSSVGPSLVFKDGAEGGVPPMDQRGSMLLSLTSTSAVHGALVQAAAGHAALEAAAAGVAPVDGSSILNPLASAGMLPLGYGLTMGGQVMAQQPVSLPATLPGALGVQGMEAQPAALEDGMMYAPGMFYRHGGPGPVDEEFESASAVYDEMQRQQQVAMSRHDSQPLPEPDQLTEEEERRQRAKQRREEEVHARNLPAHMQPAVYPAGLSDRGTSAAGEADSWLDRS